ncbi:hypothetical protein [Nostoc sp. DedQUE03]|uniref:hypothetical protein n=1 Tax=Nostoc sp. DedQUE03 TaxID=3075389 RepID=UPI002AD99CC7|nr:hypothetical protein [Nostoc sp. DedQUE03]
MARNPIAKAIKSCPCHSRLILRGASNQVKLPGRFVGIGYSFSSCLSVIQSPAMPARCIQVMLGSPKFNRILGFTTLATTDILFISGKDSKTYLDALKVNALILTLSSSQNQL